MWSYTTNGDYYYGQPDGVDDLVSERVELIDHPIFVWKTAVADPGRHFRGLRPARPGLIGASR